MQLAYQTQSIAVGPKIEALDAFLDLDEQVHLDTAGAPFALHHGGALPDVRIGYSRQGPAQRPALAVLGGISAGRHVCAAAGRQPAGWWEPLCGQGRALDTRRWQVLGMDFLGGSDWTTGPEPTLAHPSDFPDISTYDQARLLAAVLDRAGIDRLHALVGASYGGMVGLAFAELFPERLERLILISAAHRSAPLATGWRVVQRQIVEQALAAGRGDEGLALARALAMTTYRSSDEFLQRFSGPRPEGGGRDDFPVWTYLSQRGAAYKQRMAPAAFLTLSRSIDLHCVQPERVRVPLHLVTVDRDQCVPPALAEELLDRYGGPGRLHRLSSIYGHDAFLKETAFFTDLFRQCLA